MMRIATALVVALALLPACSTTVPATVTWGPSMEVTAGREVSVSANEQSARVQRSLSDAGLVVSDRGAAAPYQLRVDIGSSRGSRQGCGSINNVRYILNKGRMRVLVIKGRGPTGECQSNTLDDMSRLLESYFGGEGG